MTAPRSYLYVPGDRPDRLATAATRGADAIIADLEDAVAPNAKDDALAAVTAWLDTLPPHHPPAWVRLNTGDRGRQELRHLSTRPSLVGVFAPKVEHPDDLLALLDAAQREQILLAPMIESAAGLVHLEQIATASGVHQLHLGEIDLGADLNLDTTDDESPLAYARSRVVVASRYAGILPPAAPVAAELNHPDRFRTTTQALSRMGFRGRDCIHPAQVAIANDVFTPDPEQVAWAHAVLHQAQSAAGSFRGPDGTMVDEAVLRRARAILATT
ncbi:HpcH/HpaI aldolase [Nostocoides japonicum T1-X7]|uniref:HpcH/HpaI aldolase n=1 Tax=Nostocoides japonicum T1-X7 TaxID=1194083 RepID=A0A077LZ20_9MICO|nr:CoA ester lyase [Tetrasphaera japonica]CCH79153.1 HpcH/HpaI aldolase [Tetrasphaera japonica T1-X7]